MHDTYRIVLTAEALSDLQSIASHIRKHSPQNSASVAKTILDSIDSLASMRSRFKREGTSRKRGTPVHSMVVRPFIVYYRVEQSPAAVYVLNVRHGSRRPPASFP
ncbi:MAG TPA: type II toxin-antitoxin system RelE/ParE family toxin [Tepidisphaeraceae bacterium]|nr:type II toxin-antitoxin system RelE/ParE family toxin [Tepidisphaeraceae bacterium]